MKEFQLIRLILMFGFLLVGNAFAQSEQKNDSALPTDNPALPEIKVETWNLEYQIKLQNSQSLLFADIARKDPAKQTNGVRDKIQIEEEKKRFAEGKLKIQTGKTSTTFRNNSDLDVKEYLLARTESKELKKVIEQYAVTCIKLFRKTLQEEKLADNDMVEASSLAFIISYEIYFGEKPSKDHLQWLRTIGREILLNSPSFQGVPDNERQRTFELFGVLTMYAKMLQNGTIKDRPDAAKEARETAQVVLKEIWGNSPDTILMLPVGFIHKGQKIIRENKSSVLFNYNANLGTAEKLSAGNLQFKELFQSWLNQFQKEIFDPKLQSNDLAVCGTRSLSTVYALIANGEKMSEREYSKIYNSFKQSILISPDIQSASDDNKQIACEVFAIRAMMIKNQPPANEDIVKTFVQDLFKAFGEDAKNFLENAKNNQKNDSKPALVQTSQNDM